MAQFCQLPQRRRPRADANRAVSIGYKYTKRRQAIKNSNTDSAYSVPSSCDVNRESEWDSDTFINRQILVDEGPLRGTDMTVAWELYFQAQGLAPGAKSERIGCSPTQPHVILAKADGDGKQRHPRRQLTGFCDDCWQHAHLRHGRDEVPDMSFLFTPGVFKRGKRIDPRAKLKGRVTDNEFRSFVDSCLKANKSPGPDGYPNECVKTMTQNLKSSESGPMESWSD
jgi:hypothetical protein